MMFGQDDTTSDDGWGNEMEMLLVNTAANANSDDDNSVESLGSNESQEYNFNHNSSSNKLKRRKKRILQVPPEWLDPYAPLPTDAEFSRWIRTQLKAIMADECGLPRTTATAATAVDLNSMDIIMMVGENANAAFQQLVEGALIAGAAAMGRNSATTSTGVRFSAAGDPYHGVELSQRTF